MDKRFYQHRLDQLSQFLARRSVRVAFVLLMMLVGAGLSLLRHHYGEVTLELDAEIEAGSYMELYYNERWTEYIVAPIVQGQRSTYVFRDLPSTLFALRLDPTTLAKTRIRIYEIRIKRGDKTLYNYLPPQIRTWVNTQLDVTADSSPTVYEAISSDTDPIMRLPGPWQIGSGRLREKPFETATGRRYFDIAVIGGALLMMILMSRPRRAFLFGYLPLLVLALIQVEGRVLPLLRPLLSGYLSSDRAVGWTNYTGYPKQFEFRALIVAVVMTIGVTWAAARWLRKRWPADPPELAEPPHASASPYSRYIEFATFGLLMFLVAMTLALRLPHFPGLMQWLSSAQHSFFYDDQNFFTWRYFVYGGWRPLRDFWYPYGDFTQLDGFFPWGGGRDFLHRLVLYGVFTSSVYFLCKRSAARTAVVVAVGILASRGHEIGAEYRYAMALNLVLLALVARQLGWARLPSLALGAFAGYCLLYEPHQIAYAGVAIAPVWGGDFLWPPPGRSRAAALSALRFAGGTFALCLALRVLFLALEGRLGGQLEFILQAGPTLAYGSLEAPLLSWFRFDTDQSVMLLWGTLFLIGYGTFLRVYRRDGEWHQLGVTCLSLGLLTAAVLNKQVTRPHVAWQFLPYIALAVLFIGFRFFAHVRLRERGLMLLVAIFLLVRWDVVQVFSLATSRALMLAGDLPLMLRGVTDGDALDRIYASYFYDENRYRLEKPLIQRVKQLMAKKQSDGVQRASLYVFGDEPFLYAALRQKPPYYITFYNAAPIEAQERMVRWLVTRRPDFVVWQPGRKQFDEVPHTVRVPLMFRIVIQDYELLERVGDYHILVRRPSDKPIDLGYFRETLGETFDVGALAAHSRLRKLRACDVSRDTDCAEVLHVHIANPRPGERTTLRLAGGGQEFSLVLRHDAVVNDYYVPLSRIWFYEALRQNEPQKKQSFVGAPDVTIDVVNLAGAAQILY